VTGNLAGLSSPLILQMAPGLFACCCLINSDETLLEDEARYAVGMTPARKREFSSGRMAARCAMRELAGVESPILVGDGGEPIWPSTIVGSISHSSDRVVALIGASHRFASVGVDLEDARQIGERAASFLMTENEIGLVTRRGWAHDRFSAQSVVFSTKEAIFKCQFPISRSRDLDFKDVSLVALESGDEIGAEHRDPRDPAARMLTAIRLNRFNNQRFTFSYALLRR
jgi:4'-phosphopantetheinyl transferase EntD